MTEFEVNDKRLCPKDGALKEEEERDSGAPRKAKEEGAGAGEPKAGPAEEPKAGPAGGPKAGAADKGGGFQAPGLEASFGTLILGLSTNAHICMGDTPSDMPPGEAPPKDLKMAKHLIDVLGMLQKKTAGNLTEEESQLLSAFLYELRLKYVKLASK